MLPEASADKLYKWRDAEGNVTYQDSPPPRGVKAEEQEYQEPEPVSEVDARVAGAALENPVTLYFVPDCDSCDLVRFYLAQRRIPFSEKSVQGDVALRQELEQKTGRLEVPMLAVGEQLVEGYSLSAIAGALEAAGFPIAEIDSGLERDKKAKKEKRSTAE
ncbi:MAG: glutaredoxin family protein [Pseudomonadota bacterium]|nr:glutaredoxin family protein [Pseudomonadota bacterium]